MPACYNCVPKRSKIVNCEIGAVCIYSLVWMIVRLGYATFKGVMWCGVGKDSLKGGII